MKRDELRRLALAATPGPWSTSTWIEQPNNRCKPMVAYQGATLAITHPAPICPAEKCKHNADYIAAANPATILELLDTVETLAKHLNQAHRFIEHTAAFGRAAKSGILQAGNDKTTAWDIDESKEALAKAREQEQ